MEGHCFTKSTIGHMKTSMKSDVIGVNLLDRQWSVYIFFNTYNTFQNVNFPGLNNNTVDEIKEKQLV